jgi:hypothetical protein
MTMAAADCAPVNGVRQLSRCCTPFLRPCVFCSFDQINLLNCADHNCAAQIPSCRPAARTRHPWFRLHPASSSGCCPAVSWRRRRWLAPAPPGSRVAVVVAEGPGPAEPAVLAEQPLGLLPAVRVGPAERVARAVQVTLVGQAAPVEQAERVAPVAPVALEAVVAPGISRSDGCNGCAPAPGGRLR